MMEAEFSNSFDYSSIFKFFMAHRVIMFRVRVISSITILTKPHTHWETLDSNLKRQGAWGSPRPPEATGF